MRTFVANTVSPTVYFVGRYVPPIPPPHLQCLPPLTNNPLRSSEASGVKITTELQKINPDSRIQFMQADATLLSTVDSVTAQIAAKEKKVNLLFMSPGYMTMAGRDESPEGLDRKMVVSYYGRLRFASNLLPLLKAAAATPSESSRVISVLAPGREGTLIMDDLGLAKPGNYSLRNVEAHTVTMMSFAFEELSVRNPEIGWIHASPGVVATSLTRGLPTAMRIASSVAVTALKCFTVPIADSGHGFTWLSTNEGFRAGLFLVNWKGENMDCRVPGGRGWYSDERKKSVWDHTQTVFGGVKQ